MVPLVIAIALALGASLAWGASDFLAGLKTRELSVVWVLLVSQATGLVLVTTAAIVAGQPLPSGDAVLWAAGAGVAEVIGFAAFYRALAVGVMSVVSPVSACAAVIPVIVGLAAGDQLTIVQALGMALALGGAALASAEPEHRKAAGIGLAFFAALAFGLFFVGMDKAADDGALWAVAISRAGALSVLAVAVTALRPPAPDRSALGPLALVGGLDITANVLFTIALTVGMAGMVSVLGSLYPLATVALAVAVLHERVSGQQRTGVMAALTGIALVSLA
jgi:drug/metabolite transporter (DMT)-like permease